MTDGDFSAAKAEVPQKAQITRMKWPKGNDLGIGTTLPSGSRWREETTPKGYPTAGVTASRAGSGDNGILHAKRTFCGG
jgi:hypothetical protein